jgi:hypothetical protein
MHTVYDLEWPMMVPIIINTNTQTTGQNARRPTTCCPLIVFPYDRNPGTSPCPHDGITSSRARADMVDDVDEPQPFTDIT